MNLEYLEHFEPYSTESGKMKTFNMCSESFKSSTKPLTSKSSISSSLGSVNSSLQCFSSCSLASCCPSDNPHEEGQSSLQQEQSYRKAWSWVSLKAKRRAKHVFRNVTPHRRQRLKQLTSREKTLQGILRVLLSPTPQLAATGHSQVAGDAMAAATTALDVQRAPAGEHPAPSGVAPMNQEVKQIRGKHSSNGDEGICPDNMRKPMGTHLAKGDGEYLESLERKCEALRRQLGQQQIMCLVQHVRIMQITREAEEEAEEQAESLAAVEVTAISLQEQLQEERDKNRRLVLEAEALMQKVARLGLDNSDCNSMKNKKPLGIRQVDDWDLISGNRDVAGGQWSSHEAAAALSRCKTGVSNSSGMTSHQQQQYKFPASRHPSQLTLDLAQSHCN
jgi:hypothetical protein